MQTTQIVKPEAPPRQGAQKPQKLWDPVNVKSITNNVALVFRERNIDKLNGTAYHFIILYMGFIAHYDLAGFKAVYGGNRPSSPHLHWAGRKCEYCDPAALQQFARNLQTGEITRDPNWNLTYADTIEKGAPSVKPPSSPEYQKSVSETMRKIVEMARAFESQATFLVKANG